MEEFKQRRKPPQLHLSEYDSEDAEKETVDQAKSKSTYEGRRNSEILIPKGSDDIKVSRKRPSK